MPHFVLKMDYPLHAKNVNIVTNCLEGPMWSFQKKQNPCLDREYKNSSIFDENDYGLNLNLLISNRFKLIMYLNPRRNGYNAKSVHIEPNYLILYDWTINEWAKFRWVVLHTCHYMRNTTVILH